MTVRPSQPHVVILPVRASTQDLERAKLLARCLGMLSNAALQTMKGRVKQLRRNSEWVVLSVEGKEYSKSKKKFSNQRKEERTENTTNLKQIME